MEHPSPADVKLLLVQRCPLFQDLLPREAGEVATAASDRPLAAQEVLFRAGEPAEALYVLAAGRVKLSLPAAGGREIVVHLLAPGDLCGWPSVLTDEVYPSTARAVEPGHALAWDRPRLEALFESHPTLWRNALRITARRLREHQERCLELAGERACQRIARTLLRLIRPSGRRFEDGLLLEVPLSRAELAQMTGTSLFTVSRLLSSWEKQGIVRARRGRVLVEGPQRLSRIAQLRAGSRVEAGEQAPAPRRGFRAPPQGRFRRPGPRSPSD